MSHSTLSSISVCVEEYQGVHMSLIEGVTIEISLRHHRRGKQHHKSLQSLQARIKKKKSTSHFFFSLSLSDSLLHWAWKIHPNSCIVMSLVCHNGLYTMYTTSVCDRIPFVSGVKLLGHKPECKTIFNKSFLLSHFMYTHTQTGFP